MPTVIFAKSHLHAPFSSVSLGAEYQRFWKPHFVAAYKSNIQTHLYLSALTDQPWGFPEGLQQSLEVNLALPDATSASQPVDLTSSCLCKRIHITQGYFSSQFLLLCTSMKSCIRQHVHPGIFKRTTPPCADSIIELASSGIRCEGSLWALDHLISVLASSF